MTAVVRWSVWPTPVPGVKGCTQWPVAVLSQVYSARFTAVPIQDRTWSVRGPRATSLAVPRGRPVTRLLPLVLIVESADSVRSLKTSCPALFAATPPLCSVKYWSTQPQDRWRCRARLDGPSQTVMQSPAAPSWVQLPGVTVAMFIAALGRMRQWVSQFAVTLEMTTSPLRTDEALVLLFVYKISLLNLRVCRGTSFNQKYFKQTTRLPGQKKPPLKNKKRSHALIFC